MLVDLGLGLIGEVRPADILEYTMTCLILRTEDLIFQRKVAKSRLSSRVWGRSVLLQKTVFCASDGSDSNRQLV